MFKILSRFVGQPSAQPTPSRMIPLHWIKRSADSWLAKSLPHDHIEPIPSAHSERIQALARRTNALGPQPLWEGYAGNNIGGQTRMPDAVRTMAAAGDLYSHLAQMKKPGVLVEFGTAFGVSGMYFLAGIEANKEGMLLTFEPNAVWAELARPNLSAISERFSLTVGTFEDNAQRVLSGLGGIDMAFIDAIHTSAFVIPQLELVLSMSNSGALIILDDINFSDDMKACWAKVSTDDRFVASVAAGGRVGMLELL